MFRDRSSSILASPNRYRQRVKELGSHGSRVWESTSPVKPALEPPLTHSLFREVVGVIERQEPGHQPDRLAPAGAGGNTPAAACSIAGQRITHANFASGCEGSINASSGARTSSSPTAPSLAVRRHRVNVLRFPQKTASKLLLSGNTNTPASLKVIEKKGDMNFSGATTFTATPSFY
jgi:hypothetical protein